jgi:molybdopterin converting factor small subunit
MISVRCLGHIATSVGARELTLEGEDMDAPEIIEKLRAMAGDRDPGFTKYNTLVVVGDGDAFVPATSDRRVHGGERVVLIPFSHGG